MLTKTSAYLGLLFLSIFLAYSGALDGEFLYDDEFLVQKNQLITDLSNIPQMFITSTTEGSGGKDSFYRPMQILSYTLAHSFFGKDPFWFHFLNIFLHSINALLLFTFLSWLFTAWGVQSPSTPAFFTALLWGLHPIHNEAVAYISATADPLHFLFGLLFLLMLTRWKLRSSLLTLTLASLFFILALLSKEASVTFPGLLFATLISTRKEFWPSLKPCLLFLSFALVYVVLRKTLLDFDNSFSFYKTENIYTSSILARLYTGLAGLPEYLKLLIYPDHLQIDRVFPVSTSLFAPKVLIGLGLSLLSFLPLIFFRRVPQALLFSSLWFWSYHSLHMGVLLPLNSFFLEHWMYIPALPFFMGIYFLCSRFLKKWSAIPLFLIATILGVRTHLQAQVWLSPISLYQHILKKSPDVPRIHNNLAMTYSDRNQFPEAEKHYLRSIELSDTHPQVRHNLGLLYLRQGKVDQGIKELQKAIEINPEFFHSHLYLVKAYEFLGESEKAKAHQRLFELHAPKHFKPQN